MEFLIISGLSGAGKSRVAAILEDLGYYCVDNMPVVLIPKFAELCLSLKGRYERVALVTDVRSGENFEGLFESLDALNKLGCEFKIVFVEAAIDVIIHRYKETRRRHPLNVDGQSIEETATKEAAMLEPVRRRADYLIDTTSLSVAKLRERLIELFAQDKKDRSIIVSVISFGFKYGLPIESDLVFDVRFMPNPYYVDSLREKTGLDESVSRFVFEWPQMGEFMERLKSMIDFLLPLYIQEGKTSLVIGIGCTGGQHRSVAVANALGDHMQLCGYHTVVSHRDISRS